MNDTDRFDQLVDFLCQKYAVNRAGVFVEYTSRRPPPVQGSRLGYYDGLLSYRKRNGQPEFLITVFAAARDPLLTLAHEFAHLVTNVKSGDFDKQLSPPDDKVEAMLDNQARADIVEFRSKLHE